MKRKNYKSAVLEWAFREGWFKDLDFCLLDVGASGGIDQFWDQFRPQLEAVGFDPLSNEVNRLNKAETDEKISYVSAWVGNGQKVAFPDGENTVFAWTSAHKLTEILNQNYVKEQFNSGEELVYSDVNLRIDDFIKQHKKFDTDFLKIDTDSFDYFVIEGALRTLSDEQILFVECECTYHELSGHSWPVFAEIDQKLRSSGYRLIDLDTWNYTRGALPGRFKFNIAAQTHDGQVMFCDALYALDFTIDTKAWERLAKTPEKLIKATVLFAVLGYNDIAAAAVMKIRDQLPDLAKQYDFDAFLDRLVGPNPFGAQSYLDYMAVFSKDPESFFDSNWRKTEMAKAIEMETDRSGDDDLSIDPRGASWLSQMQVGEAGSRLESGAIETLAGRSGCICFGPYADLPVGKYALSAQFEAQVPNRLSTNKARIEIVSGDLIIYKEKLSNRQTSFNTVFEIDEELAQKNSGIELRIFTFNKAAVRLNNLMVGRVFD